MLSMKQIIIVSVGRIFFMMRRLRKPLQNTNNNHPKTLRRENDPCNGTLVALPLFNEIGCDIINQVFTYLENLLFFFFFNCFQQRVT